MTEKVKAVYSRCGVDGKYMNKTLTRSNCITNSCLASAMRQWALEKRYASIKSCDLSASSSSSLLKSRDCS